MATDCSGADFPQAFFIEVKRQAMRENGKSALLYEAACKVMPGGVNSPVRSCRAVGCTPRFIASARGSKIYDVDGNEFIDYVCSWGPSILGHAHPAVIAAVKEACEDGLTFGAPTAREVELAELIRECMPSVEVSRMVNSGTEAVMSAIRVARGWTKRDKIIKFEGCYHGHSDGMLVKAGSGLLTGGVASSEGVPKEYAKLTLVAPYNDMAAVKKIFAENKGEIAAVIVEPVAANMGVMTPAKGFLEFLREITRCDGALLIFDEVITGFRLGLGGAQGLFGIKSDLTTLGKIVGGGMSAAVYGGREEIMRKVAPDGNIYQAGTLSGNPLATAAGIATIKEIRKQPGFYEKLERKTRGLAAFYKEVYGEAIKVNQIASLMSIDFAEDPDASFSRYYAKMIEGGIYVAPSRFEAMFVSAAHTDEDVEKTKRAILHAR